MRLGSGLFYEGTGEPSLERIISLAWRRQFEEGSPTSTHYPKQCQGLLHIISATKQLLCVGNPMILVTAMILNIKALWYIRSWWVPACAFVPLLSTYCKQPWVWPFGAECLIH